MSVVAMKNKVEQAFVDGFADVAAALPGDERVLDVRKAALARFDEVGLPHRRIEEWKYTDLRNAVGEALPPLGAQQADALDKAKVTAALGPLGSMDAHVVVLVDGVFSKALSSTDKIAGLSITSFADVLASGKSAFSGAEVDGADGVMALNAAYVTDGCVIDVDAGSQISKPIVVAQIRASETAGWTATRNTIRLGAKCEVSIVEAFVGADGAAAGGQTNAASNVVVGDNAKVTHVKCVVDGDGVTHLANWHVSIGTDATYRGFQFTQGAGVVRNQMAVVFDGEGGALDLSGAFLSRGREHVDNTMVVDHKVPGCESRELFKCVLDDSARGVVQGKVIVRQDAQKTDGKQMAQALMLSPDTEFDSKPELEIYADDVVCGHGSTVAELDNDLMFYCRSRGIPEPRARALLVQSFVGEAIEAVEDEAVADALRSYAATWLKPA